MAWSVHPITKQSKYNNEFTGFYILPPLKKVSPLKLHMHLLKEINEGTWLVSLALALTLHLTSHDWPRGLSPEAPSSYKVVSFSDLEFGWVAPHMTNKVR